VEEVFGLIRRLHEQGLAILLVEQNVFQSLEIADRAYVLENGAIVMSGVPADLIEDAGLKKSYLGM
jgi:branched-chain amino acid transport system ATP-binding protein